MFRLTLTYFLKIAFIVMVPIIAKEGVEALRSETCDDCLS
jgi:hypothetical protein